MRTKSLTNWEYVLEEDRELPENEQTVHVFRQITFDEQTVFQQLVASNQEASAAALLLQATYVGHRNMMNADGQSVEERRQTRTPLGKKVQTICDSTLNLLTNQQRAELIHAAVTAGQVSEDDAKN